MFGYKTEKYSALTGHEFSVKNFLADRKNKESLLNGVVTLKFGGGKEIDFYGYCIGATIKKPDTNTARRIADSCIQRSGLSQVSQTSDLHKLHLFSGEGHASLEFRIDGAALQGRNVRYGAVDNPQRVKKLIKSWTQIAKTLGFETHIPKTVNIGGCEAVKLCTRYKNIGEGTENQYVLDTLLANNDALEAELSVYPTNGCIDKVTISRPKVDVFAQTEEKSLQFVLDMFGEVGQPLVEYKLKEKPQPATPAQSQSRLGKAFENYFPFTLMPLTFGLSGLLSGIKHGDPLAYAAIGAGIGLGMDVILVTAWKAGSAINKWYAERKDRELQQAYKRLAELAEESSYIKQGFCVLLTTKSCATKAQPATAAAQG